MEKPTKDLYVAPEFGTLRLGIVATRAQCAGVARPLERWLEPFEVCFTQVAQRGAFRRYPLGLLRDSRRKSMSAMLDVRACPAGRVAEGPVISDDDHGIASTVTDETPLENLVMRFSGPSPPLPRRR